MDGKDVSEAKPRSALWRANLVVAFVAGIAGVISAGISVLTIPRQDEKAISVIAFDPVPLIEVDSNIANIIITVNGKPIEQAWLQTIIYQNNGKDPIQAVEIEEHTKIVFAEGEIIGAQLRQTAPANLKLSVSTGAERTVDIVHGLLNSGDRAIIDIFLSSNPKEPPTCLFRISGVSDCRTTLASSQPSTYLTFIGSDSIFAIGFVLFSVAVGIIGLVFIGFLFFSDLFKTLSFRRIAKSTTLRGGLSHSERYAIDQIENRTVIDLKENARYFIPTNLNSDTESLNLASLLASNKIDDDDKKYISKAYFSEISEKIREFSRRYWSYYEFRDNVPMGSIGELENYILEIAKKAYAEDRREAIKSVFWFLIFVTVTLIVLNVVGGPARTLFTRWFSDGW